MMAKISQSIVFIVFVFGCSVILGEGAPCEKSAIEECAAMMVNATSNANGQTCGVLDAASKCYDDIVASACEMSNDTNTMVSNAVKEIEMSKKDCKNNQGGDQAPSGKTTCDVAAVQKCGLGSPDPQMAMGGNQTDGAAPSVSVVCSALNKASMCMSAALVNCLQSGMKAQLEMMLERVTTNMTSWKCCNEGALKKCMPVEYKITEDNADKETCKSLSNEKPCVTKELKKCEDKSVKDTFEDKMTVQLEICENKGYLGSGTSPRPAIILIGVSFMAFVSTLI